MGKMSELDLLIRTYIRADKYWEKISPCSVCKSPRRIEGFIPPITFKVRCTNERCPSYETLSETRIGEEKYANRQTQKSGRSIAR